MGSETRKAGFQFSLRFLVLLTLVVAVFLSMNRAIAVVAGKDALVGLYVVLAKYVGMVLLSLALTLAVIYAAARVLSVAWWMWKKCLSYLRNGEAITEAAIKANDEAPAESPAE